MKQTKQSNKNQVKPANKNQHPELVVNRFAKLEIFIPIGICLITLLCFSHIFSNQFLFWDDNQFILNNINIRRFTWENMRQLISHEYGANWQPLTMLSYSINYYFSKYSPFGYFFTNVLFHLGSTAMVFFIIKKLLISFWGNAKMKPTLLIAGIVSLWFGIHPMHVESVGWLFERKDVLYTFFYLLGLLFYIKYVNGEKSKGMFILNILLTILSLWALIGLSGPSFHFMVKSFHITIWPPVVLLPLAIFFAIAALGELKFIKVKVELFYVFEFFFFALISKPMAVVFPFSILLIDFFLNRKFKKNVLIEKIPFLALSFVIGLLTLQTQDANHALDSVFPLSDRFFIACYSFTEYIVKLFFPFHLSGFYPYPVNPGTSLPTEFYLRPLLLILVTVVPLYFTYKKNKAWFKVLAFGLGFYLVNIALVLQFFSVGNAIISDRYSYMSYIGLFFIIAYFLNVLIEKSSESVRFAIMTAGVLFTAMLGYLCFDRTYAWTNTETMLTDVINQYPEKVPQAYKYLGIYYGETGRPKDAFNCYDIVINKMHLMDPQAYCNMGMVYIALNNLKEAGKYLLMSIKLDSNSFMSYRNLGQICLDTGNYAGAFHYFDKAKSIYANDEGLYFEISLAHVATQQYAEAVKDYNLLLQMNPDNAKYYYNRGIAEYSLGQKDAATDDFKKTLSMPVTPQNAPYHMDANSAHNLSVLSKERGDTKAAEQYDEMAKKLGAQ